MTIQCAWCRKVQINGTYVVTDNTLDHDASHGICPECEAKMMVELRAARKYAKSV